MLFEMRLSQTALLSIYARRFSPLEYLCFGLPQNLSETPYFNRVDLRGQPTFSAVPEARTLALADGSSMYMWGTRLRVTQQFDIYGAVPSPTFSGFDSVTTVGPATGSLSISVRLEVQNGSASLCADFESLTLPPLVSPQLAQNASNAVAGFISETCTPVPIGDLLNQLTAQLPGGASLFESTDVLNAGLTLDAVGELVIRIEVDTIDPHTSDQWKKFYDGTDIIVFTTAVVDPNAPPPPPIDWMVTIDRRLFSRLVSNIIANVEANSDHDGKPGYLDLAKPSIKWHVSKELWGVEFVGMFPIPKKLSDGLPTLTAHIDGTAVDVCGGVFGATDIDFSADVRVAFAVPAQDTLRFYVGVSTDASDWDQFKCGVNLTATFSAPLIPIIGPFGLAAGAFLAILVLSLSGGAAGNFAFDKNCFKEYGLDICDYPWPGNTPVGTLHLTSVMGVPQGLMLMGSLFSLSWPPTPALQWKASSKFAWHPLYCAPIEEETDYRAEAWVQVINADVCDVRLVNDPESAYSAVTQTGARSILVTCTRTVSNLPAYDCRLLVATTRGVFLARIPAPPASASLDALKEEQQIMCMEFATAFDNSKYTDWVQWAVSPVEMDPPETIHADLNLVVVDVAIAGLGAGESAHLQADGHVIATAMPGPLGITSLLGALDADHVNSQFSVVSAGRRQGAPLRSPAIDAHLEFWRSAGSAAVIGEIRALSRPESESCWMATSHGLLRFGLHSAGLALLDHIPAPDVYRLAATEYGVFTGGRNGLGLLDYERGEVRRLHDIGPVYALLRRASTLYAVGKHSIRTFQLRWLQDARGRRRSLDVRPLQEVPVSAVRSALLTGPFLIVMVAEAIDVLEVQRSGHVGPAQSHALAGLRDIQRASGADMHGAIVAIFPDRASLIRLGPIENHTRKLESLDLPQTPWFVGTQSSPGWVLRQRPNESVIDLYQMMQRVDLVRREAQLRMRPARS